MATARTPRTTSRSSATPPALEPTPISEWKKPEPPLELPSGKVMVCRKSSFNVFMKLGIIPNSLMATVQSAIDKGKAPDMEKLQDEETDVNEMLEMIDEVLMFVAVTPKVHPAPDNEADRDESILYVDEVDEEDKMFIYQWCTGGTRDLERFREELASNMESVRGSQEVAVPAL